jgi:hypothetical protein
VDEQELADSDRPEEGFLFRNSGHPLERKPRLSVTAFLKFVPAVFR